MTETKNGSLEAVTSEQPSPITADEVIKILRSLCQSAGMIGNHVAAIHLEAWRAIDNLTSKGLLPDGSGAKSQVSQDDLSGLMTPEEVAQILGVCRATLLKMRKNGRFPQPIFMSARKLRYVVPTLWNGWTGRLAWIDPQASQQPISVSNHHGRTSGISGTIC